MKQESPPAVDSTDRKDRSTTEARQGVTGHNVRYVLLFGILGTVLAFAVALAIAT